MAKKKETNWLVIGVIGLFIILGLVLYMRGETGAGQPIRFNPYASTSLIVVEAVNKAPTIELDSPITVQEGDTIVLDPKVTDPEGDEVVITYSDWMGSNTKTTDYNDAGEHNVDITARDTVGNEATMQLTIIVEDVNRPPIFGAGSFE